MLIVYESQTGFTKKYAEMLAAETNLRACPVRDLSKSAQRNEEILFLGWMKIGKIQELSKARKFKLVAVCGSGTGQTAEPDEQTVIARNHLEGIPFFYLRGGCLPLKELKGLNRILLSMFVGALKKRGDRDEKLTESIDIIENGFDGVKKENLAPLLAWLQTR